MSVYEINCIACGRKHDFGHGAGECRACFDIVTDLMRETGLKRKRILRAMIAEAEQRALAQWRALAMERTL